MRVALIILAFTTSLKCLGATPPDALKSKISKIQFNIAELDTKVTAANMRLERIIRYKSKVEDDLQNLQLEIAELVDQIAENEKTERDLRKKMRHQLNTSSQNQSLSWISNLARSESIVDLEIQFEILKKITKNNFSDLSRISKLKQDSIQKQQILASREVRLKKAQEKYQGTLTELNEENKLKQSLVTQARKSLEQKIKKLKISQIPPSLQRSLYEQKGSLELPMTGSVLKNYGWQTIDGTTIKHFHRGILLEAPMTTTVHSVFEGQVALAEQFAEWGYTVVVDHGDHYYTMYSNIDSPKVRIGDRVRRRSEIGTSSKLYFEIRHFTEPQKPSDWLKGILQ